MASLRAYNRWNVRENAEEEGPPKDPHVLVNPFVEQVINVELRDSLQAMKAQVNREIVILINPNVGLVDSSVTNFTRINPSTFYISKVEEYPQELLMTFVRF